MPEKKASLDTAVAKLSKFVQMQNVAEDLDEQQLSEIGSRAAEEYKIDLESRSDWEETANRAMELALQTKREKKNFPFENASNVNFPVITVAALQFNARAYPAIVDGVNIVKGRPVGSDTGVPALDQNGQQMVLDPQTGEPTPIPPNAPPELVQQLQPAWVSPPGFKREKARRIGQHMSYQLLEEMEEWDEETDTLLIHIPIIGCAFRKVFHDEPSNKSLMINAVDLVVNNTVRSLEQAPRISHRFPLYPQGIEERKRDGRFLEDVDLPAASSPAPPPSGEGDSSPALQGDDDAPHTFVEQHRWEDLDGDGFREPYIVTFHLESEQVVRIKANFRLGDVEHDQRKITRIKKQAFFVKYSFIPDPKGGFYDIGFGHLLESLGHTIDTTLNQLLDAGTLQNAGGGFIGSGVRLGKSTVKQSPGKWMNVQAPGARIREAMVPIEHPGPSQALFNLLVFLIDAAKDITATKDILTGETGGKTQTATTTLALIEQGLKVFTAIYKRIYRSLKKEFKILFRLNAEHLQQDSYFEVLDEQAAVSAQDYDVNSVDVSPVADPRIVTDMQRLGKAQLLMEVQAHPIYGQIQDPQESLKRFYEAAGIEEPDRLIKKPAAPGPAEILDMEGKAAKTSRDEAAARKDDATAQKEEIEAAKKAKEIESMQLDDERKSVETLANIGALQ